MPKSSTYWVRSKEINEVTGYGRTVPARFKSLAEAKLYRRELNLHRGPFHPGYIVEKQNDNPPLFLWRITNPGRPGRDVEILDGTVTDG